MVTKSVEIELFEFNNKYFVEIKVIGRESKAHIFENIEDASNFQEKQFEKMV